jgi:hypothetical protein
VTAYHTIIYANVVYVQEVELKKLKYEWYSSSREREREREIGGVDKQVSDRWDMHASKLSILPKPPSLPQPPSSRPPTLFKL